MQYSIVAVSVRFSCHNSKLPLRKLAFLPFQYVYFPPFLSSVTPEQWASLTDTNIAKTEQQCKASASLRGVIDSILSQCFQDLEAQRAKVDLAFQKRAQEIADAKRTLEQHLAKVGLHANAQPPCVGNWGYHAAGCGEQSAGNH